MPARLLEQVFLPLDPASALARLESYREAGADLPIVYPVVPWNDEAPEAARATIRGVLAER